MQAIRHAWLLAQDGKNDTRRSLSSDCCSAYCARSPAPPATAAWIPACIRVTQRTRGRLGRGWHPAHSHAHHLAFWFLRYCGLSFW